MRPLATFAATANERRLGPEPTREVRLRPTDVDVWRASLDDQPPEAMQMMQALISADEAERARRFYFERDRQRFIVGRGVLRLLLARYTGRAAKDIVFTYGPNGKPALATARGTPPPIFFNLAHSDGLALYAFTQVGEVGIDVERIRDLPEWEQVAASAFSAHELQRLYACPTERRREEFFRAWTRQEAILKALGTGLGATTASGASAEAAFSVHPLNPGPGYAAALAAGAAGQWTTCHTWNAQPNNLESIRSGKRIRLEGIPEHGASFL